MKLIMPSNMTEERRAAMAAYGAELINVPAGKMEMARDLALEMQVSKSHQLPPPLQIPIDWTWLAGMRRVCLLLLYCGNPTFP